MWRSVPSSRGYPTALPGSLILRHDPGKCGGIGELLYPGILLLLRGKNHAVLLRQRRRFSKPDQPAVSENLRLLC